MNTLRWVLAAVAVGASAACGVPVDHSARPIGAEDLPLHPQAPATTTPSEALDAVVFLARDGRLASVRRPVGAPASVANRLDALAAGPTRAESDGGLRTAIGPDTRLTATGPTDGIVTIDLSRSFADVTGEDQILAVAQIVFTATEAPAVTAVRFTLEGTPVAVPLEDGTLSEGPIGRSGFPGLGP